MSESQKPSKDAPLCCRIKILHQQVLILGLKLVSLVSLVLGFIMVLPLTTGLGGVSPTLVAHLHNPIQPPTFSDSTSNFQPKTATLTSMGLFWDPSLLAPT